MGIFCPECKQFIVLDGMPRSSSRLVLWPLAVLVVSYLVAIVLVRRSGMLWPAYFFVAVTFLNLSAMAFSRGAVIKRAAIATAVVIACWASTLESVLIPFAGPPGSRVGPVAAWGALVAYGYFLGRSVPDGQAGTQAIRGFSIPFLTMAAFVFGMWGVLGIYSQYRMGFGWLLDLIVLAVALVPLGLIAWDVGNPAEERSGGWVAIASSVLFAASSYLTVLQLLLSGLGDLRGRLPWQIQGVDVLSGGHPPWVSLLAWKSVVSLMFVGIAFVMIIASSAARALQESKAHGPFLRADITAAEQRRASIPDGIPLVSEQVDIAAMRFMQALFLLVDFVRRTLVATVVSAVDALRRALLGLWTQAWKLGLPLVALSAFSLLAISTLHDIVRYGAGSSVGYGGPSLWGGLICTATILLVLGSASFSLFPEAAKGDAQPDLRLFGAIAAPTALIAWMFASLVTLATPWLWVMDLVVHRAGIRIQALGYGPLLRTDLFSLLAFTLLASIPTALTVLSGKQHELAKQSRPGTNAIAGWTLCVLVVLATVLAALLGWQPLLHWIANAK